MKFILIFCGIVLITALIFVIDPLGGENRGKRERAEPLTRQIASAFTKYKMEYGAYPDGDYDGKIRAIRGDNPRKIVFIVFLPQDLDASGRPVDPWGVAYYIELPPGDSRPRVWSSGPNKKSESSDPKSNEVESDDVVSWN